MNTVCKEHEWVDSLYFNLKYDKPVQMCRKCRRPKLIPTDFKIDENLKVIEDNEWDGIIELYCNEIKFELGEVKHVVVPLLHWLKNNYLAPEKKNN